MLVIMYIENERVNKKRNVIYIIVIVCFLYFCDKSAAQNCQLARNKWQLPAPNCTKRI